VFSNILWLSLSLARSLYLKLVHCATYKSDLNG
jgi:hypothetical protein